MILADIDIFTLARRELVTPFDKELVNPASLDPDHNRQPQASQQFVGTEARERGRTAKNHAE